MMALASVLLVTALLHPRHEGTTLAFLPAPRSGRGTRRRRGAAKGRQPPLATGIVRAAAASSDVDDDEGSPIERWAALASSRGTASLGPVSVGPSTILGPGVRCGRGLFAASDVARHDELFSVRSEAILTVDDAFDDVDDGDAFRSLVGMGPGWDTVAFAGWIAKLRLLDMLERGGGGEDGEEDEAATLRDMYLRSLPWSGDEQPHVLWWSDGEAERLLGGSCVYDEAMGIRSDVAGSTALLAGLLEPTVKGVLSGAFSGGENDISKLGLGTDLDCVYRTLMSSLVRAAFVVLMSRSFDDSLLGATGGDDAHGWDDDNHDDDFDEDDDDDDDDPGGRNYRERLVPLFDTMQHTSGDPTVYHTFDDDLDAIVVYAARDLRRGEELVISYHDEMEPRTFGARFGFVPGEARSVRTLLDERSLAFFPPPGPQEGDERVMPPGH